VVLSIAIDMIDCEEFLVILTTTSAAAAIMVEDDLLVFCAPAALGATHSGTTPQACTELWILNKP
jgi:hypothetical protein